MQLYGHATYKYTYKTDIKRDHSAECTLYTIVLIADQVLSVLCCSRLRATHTHKHMFRDVLCLRSSFTLPAPTYTHSSQPAQGVEAKLNTAALSQTLVSCLPRQHFRASYMQALDLNISKPSKVCLCLLK